MPKIKMFISFIVIVLAVALVGGATMAWFTDSSAPLVNQFEAGTIEIEAGDKTQIPNWNPGDQSEAEFCVTNVGSKNALVRIGLDGEWAPGPYRILVLYTSDSIQLIGVEWATFCQGCTGTEGPMATASAAYSYSSSGSEPDVVLDNDYYFGTTFTNLDQGDNTWLNETDTYTGWCLDKDVTITLNQLSGQEVDIYDPFCNPNWYEEATDNGTLQNRWANIDFDKISYIINHDFLSRGYNSTEVQQAIWNYTNDGYNDARYIVGDAQEIVDYIDGIGPDIVAALNDIVDTVSTSLHSDSLDDWSEIEVEGETHYYYNEMLGDGEEVCLKLNINLSGPNTTNIFQGMDYTASGYFEAVQASNNASASTWGVNSNYNPDDPESSENWDEWGTIVD